MGIDTRVIVGYGLVLGHEFLKNELKVDNPFEHGEFIMSMDMDGDQFFIGTIFEESASMRWEPLDVHTTIDPRDCESSKEATMEVIEAESFLPGTLINYLKLHDWKIVVYTEYS